MSRYFFLHLFSSFLLALRLIVLNVFFTAGSAGYQITKYIGPLQNPSQSSKNLSNVEEISTDVKTTMKTRISVYDAETFVYVDNVI